MPSNSFDLNHTASSLLGTSSCSSSAQSAANIHTAKCSQGTCCCCWCTCGAAGLVQAIQQFNFAAVAAAAIPNKVASAEWITFSSVDAAAADASSSFTTAVAHRLPTAQLLKQQQQQYLSVQGYQAGVAHASSLSVQASAVQAMQTVGSTATTLVEMHMSGAMQTAASASSSLAVMESPAATSEALQPVLQQVQELLDDRFCQVALASLANCNKGYR